MNDLKKVSVVVADTLVERELIDPARRPDVAQVVADVLNGDLPAGQQKSWKVVVAEIASYLGATLVLGAIFLLVGQDWSRRAWAVSAFFGAVILSAAGAFMAYQITGTQWWSALRELRNGHHEWQRRLVAALWAAAAICAGLGVGLLFEPPRHAAWPELSAVLGFSIAAGLALVATRWCPSVVSHWVAGGASMGAVVTFIQWRNLDPVGTNHVTLIALAALGVLWLGLEYAGWWRVSTSAQVWGLTLIVSAVLMQWQDMRVWWTQLILLVIAVAPLIARYMWRPHWPFMAAPILMILVYCVMFLNKFSSSTGLVILGVGLVMLAVGALSLVRRRRTSTPPDQGSVSESAPAPAVSDSPSMGEPNI